MMSSKNANSKRINNLMNKVLLNKFGASKIEKKEVVPEPKG